MQGAAQTGHDFGVFPALDRPFPGFRRTECYDVGLTDEFYQNDEAGLTSLMHCPGHIRRT